jgi:dihydroxyacetone kinase-like protein
MTGAAITGAAVSAWLQEAERIVVEQADYLTQLDAAIGDGDHGTNMSRGFKGLGDALREQGDGLAPGEMLQLGGKTVLSTVGGASGALWGSALRAAGKSLGDGDVAGDAEFVVAIDAAVAAVVDLGAASPGDKTMVDALIPARDALRAAVEAGQPLAEGARVAADAAEQGAKDSTAMEARKGRASYLGPRSVGHPDPGATSTAMVLDALARTLSG